MPARTTATSRSTASRSPRPGTPAGGRRRRTGPGFNIPPEILRLITGLVMVLLGVSLLIGLTVKGGQLTDYEWYILAPLFGTIRWLLPFVLIALGYYLERADGDHWDWELTIVGATVSYLSFDGVAGIVAPGRAGVVGRTIADVMTPLITTPGAAVVLSILSLAGLLLALDMSLPAVMAPFGRLVARSVAVLFRPAPEPPEGSILTAPSKTEKPSKAGKPETMPLPEFGEPLTSSIPSATPSTAPVSSTFAPTAMPPAPAPIPSAFGGRNGHGIDDDGDDRREPERIGRESHSIRDGGPIRGPHPRLDVQTKAGEAGLAAGVVAAPRPEYKLPPLSMLDDIAPAIGDSSMDHQRNATIIAAKLASFNIPARVVRTNPGPVVTQYEVEPAPEIKVSRIEALSDDLAMALAARTIRIEAPIPGKSVVGIEIPNKDFNIVALRRVMEEVDFRTTSKLTFALGRDVAGHARAADLSKMPHLLIAGATGSGKSVMVNALISSLLCRATPDEVRLVLVDLKRVELSAYNGLPHLMVPVITEPERAKAALKWAVIEMENRYRKFAGANARNIAGYNETRVDPADRVPYLVVIVDELADLMMREGRDVEDAIVRLAQKARATGIHMVLATQRPSVNVVTGLIKANFPSRIAFAMASQIDSRTILDMPGAEDLIGRGDMLFQPADLPRPIRLQGVYVSDKEISNITSHWRAEAQPHYDMGILDTGEEVERSEEEPDDDADRLLLDAVGVVQEYDRASASLLQRRLKIGYARAARIIDQLEARGYIGPFDGSNARQVLRREATPPGPAFGHGEDEV